MPIFANYWQFKILNTQLWNKAIFDSEFYKTAIKMACGKFRKNVQKKNVQTCLIEMLHEYFT